MGRIKSQKGPDYKKRGKPAGKALNNTGLKDVKTNDLDTELEIAEKYTTGSSEEPAENINTRHPNRNLNKPDINKPPYS